LVHDFTSKSSFLSASNLPRTIPGNNSQVAFASALASGLEFVVSRSHKRVLIVSHNPTPHYFMVGVNAATKGGRMDALKAAIRDSILQFDQAYCSLVVEGQFLAESYFVQALSSLYAFEQLAVPIPPCTATPLLIKEINSSLDQLVFSVIAYAPLNDVPVISQLRLSQCAICGSPYHMDNRCFTIGNGSTPKLSIFGKVAPVTSLLFSDSFANPALIHWDSAPQRLPNTVFVRFMATMLIVGILDDHMLHAQLALIHLAELYDYSPFHRQLILKSSRADVLNQEFGDPISTASKIHERAAKEIRTCALLIEQRHYAKANRYIYREEKINVDDPRILQSDWEALHPLAPAAYPSRRVFTIPYDHSDNEYFRIHRQSLCDIISKWDVELAPGLSGFPASFLIHFNNSPN